MEESKKFPPLSQVWGDPVKGSWWKAIVIFITYFGLRIVMEKNVLLKGIAISGETPTLEDMQNPLKIMEYMGNAPLQYHLSTLILLIFILLMASLFKFKFFDIKRISIKKVGWTIMIYIIFFVINILFSTAQEYFYPDYTLPVNQAAVEVLVKNMQFIGVFFNLVILTPITEELLLRGLVMKYLFPLTPVIGALVSAVLFTLLHSPGNIVDFLIYFILSCGITYVYWKTRKLEYPIIYHMIQNFIATMALLPLFGF